MDNKLYIHTAEGKDDMPAHIKSTLTNNQIALSIKESELLLGTWQGLYLFEHRLNTQNRTIIHHFILFSLDNFSFNNLNIVLLNTLYSSIFTLVLYFLGSYILRKKQLH